MWKQCDQGLTDKGDFQSKMSSLERRDVVEMVVDLDAFCQRNSASCFLMYGTLLGALRHGGIIPWDDDADVGLVCEDHEKLMDDFQNNYKDKYFVNTFWGGWKVSCLKNYRIPGYECSYPFVDVFGYVHKNKRVTSLSVPTEENFEENLVFPTKTIIFENCRVPVPCDSEAILKQLYGSEWKIQCVSSTYDHRHEDRVSGKPIEIPCECLPLLVGTPILAPNNNDLPERMQRIKLGPFVGTELPTVFAISVIISLDIQSSRAAGTIRSLSKCLHKSEVIWMQAFNGKTEWQEASRLMPEMPIHDPLHLTERQDLVQEYARKQGLSTQPILPGHQGASCSHLYVWKVLAQHLDYNQWALVFEDDVVLYNRFSEALAQLWPSKPERAQMVNLFNTDGFENEIRDLGYLPERKGKFGRGNGTWINYYWIKYVGYGAACYAISKEGARRLYEAFSKHKYMMILDADLYYDTPFGMSLVLETLPQFDFDTTSPNFEPLRVRSGFITTKYSQSTGSDIVAVNQCNTVRRRWASKRSCKFANLFFVWVIVCLVLVSFVSVT